MSKNILIVLSLCLFSFTVRAQREAEHRYAQPAASSSGGSFTTQGDLTVKGDAGVAGEVSAGAAVPTSRVQIGSPVSANSAGIWFGDVVPSAANYALLANNLDLNISAKSGTGSINFWAGGNAGASYFSFGSGAHTTFRAIVPAADGSANLGSTAARFNAIYGATLRDGNSAIRVDWSGATEGNAYRGAVADSATAIAHKFGNTATLATAGAKIAAWYADNTFTAERASISQSGTLAAVSVVADAVLGGSLRIGATGTNISASYEPQATHDFPAIAAGDTVEQAFGGGSGYTAGAPCIVGLPDDVSLAKVTPSCRFVNATTVALKMACNGGGAACDPAAGLVYRMRGFMP